jgi:hypothetical protein
MVARVLVGYSEGRDMFVAATTESNGQDVGLLRQWSPFLYRRR